MKLTLSWLKEHLDTDAPVGRLAEALTALGLEVEDVIDRGAALAPFTVARVLAAQPHPDADKLKVCRVDTGAGEAQVVCGAPNARAGMLGVFAPPGTHIPGTGLDLRTGVIRGVESAGMLVSERELGLSDEHAGIIELPEDSPVGAPFARVSGLDDPVIDIALTPDRADCAGVRGIARDLAAAGHGTLRPLDETAVPGAYPCPVGVRRELPPGPPDPCPLFVARHLRGLTNGPSPRWLADRLTAVGLRPISALVDITNLLTLDRARPLHVFDAARLRGDLVLRPTRPGERLEALNDRTYTMPDDAITGIYDDSGLISLAGIIGGASTGVTEATTEVLLEVALFDPVRTAATGRKLQIESDARYRFERGVDPGAVLAGVEQATRLILALCGGEASEPVVAGAVPPPPEAIALRRDRVATLGGLDLPLAEQVRILRRLGCTVHENEDGALRVTPPSWRGDLTLEADLVEELLRIAGYDAVPALPLPRLSAVTRPAVGPERRRADRVRRALAARGLEEAVTWSFMADDVAARFGFADPALRLLNPIASDLAAMRPSILPNLLQAAGRNAARGLADAGLFELGPVYRDPTPAGQERVAAGVRAGRTGPRHWAETPRAVDVFDAKADALAALEVAGAPVGNLQVTADAPGWYHPGRSGMLRLGPTVLAQFGEAHPLELEALDVAGPVAAFEVFVDRVPLPRRSGTARPLLQLSPFQPVSRDFAFIADADVPAERLARAARGADKALIAEVAVFDVYAGMGVPEGRKSVALAVTLQPTEATLTEEQIEAVAGRIVAAVEKQGGRLRA